MGGVCAGDDDLDGSVSGRSQLSRRLVGLLVSAVLLVGACGAAGSGGGTSAGDGLEADAAWRAERLTDVRTGASFSVDELRGKLVAIEPMAIWCVNCRIQQAEARAALEAIDSDDLVYIGVDVDPNEEPDALARYAADHGFDWTYVVATADMARALASAFGPQILSPPSTPMILVEPGGTVVDVHFGIRGPRELEALFRQHLP